MPQRPSRQRLSSNAHLARRIFNSTAFHNILIGSCILATLRKRIRIQGVVCSALGLLIYRNEIFTDRSRVCFGRIIAEQELSLTRIR